MPKLPDDKSKKNIFIDNFGGRNETPLPSQGGKILDEDFLRKNPFLPKISGLENVDISEVKKVAADKTAAINEVMELLSGNSSSDLPLENINDDLPIKITDTIQDTVVVDNQIGDRIPVAVWKENLLDEYENYTYNFKLSLAPERIAISDTQPNSSDLIVIAQSGVTSLYTIKDVEINTYVSPNFRTRNSSSYMFKIQIVETSGVTFLDRLLNVATNPSMSISNIMNIPFFLELNFLGFNNGVETNVSDYKRLWKVFLIDIKTELDIGGASYELTFHTIEDQGFQKYVSAFMLKQPININARTVGEFFDKFAQTLNLQETIAAINENITRNEFEFVITEDVRNWEIVEPVGLPNSPSTNKESDGSAAAPFPPQTLLYDIVDSVLSCTKEAVKLINPGSNPEEIQNPNDKGRDVSKVFMIHCDVRYIAYNPNTKEYIKKYVYYISPYETFRLVTNDPSNVDKTDRLSYMINNSLRKKYEYIFTGQNTNILNLDLNLNNLWRNAVTQYSRGIHRENNQNATFIKSEPVGMSTDDIFSLKDGKYNHAQNYSAIPENESITSEINYTPINEQVLSSERTKLSQRAEYMKEYGINAPEDLEKLKNEIDRQQDIIPVEGIAQQANIEFPESRLVGGLTQGQRLLEDLPLVTFEQTIIDNMQIKALDPSIDISHVMDGIDDTISKDRTIFGILTTKLYETSSDLLNIEMTIRGDPFWLGETNFEKINKLKTMRDILTMSMGDDGEFASFLNKENLFYLKFNTPNQYDEDSGFMKMDTDNTFEGLYAVHSVTSSFSDGKFIQNLSAIRDPHIKPQDIKKFVRNS